VNGSKVIRHHTQVSRQLLHSNLSLLLLSGLHLLDTHEHAHRHSRILHSTQPIFPNLTRFITPPYCACDSSRPEQIILISGLRMMASSLQQFVHDKLIYATAYLQGRFYALPRGPSDVYGLFVSKLTSLIALPLPLLSFLVVPFYGGSSTTVSLLVFVSPIRIRGARETLMARYRTHSNAIVRST
jgi:hypothetical protein